MTKRIAQRGARSTAQHGVPDQFQHFAIVLDDRVISLAAIDPTVLPNGIDGRTGAQIQGLGGLQDTRNLAASLASGPLPAELVLVSKR